MHSFRRSSILWGAVLLVVGCARGGRDEIRTTAPEPRSGDVRAVSVGVYDYEGLIEGFGAVAGSFGLDADGGVVNVSGTCAWGPEAPDKLPASCRFRTFRVQRDNAGTPTRAYVVLTRALPNAPPNTCVPSTTPGRAQPTSCVTGQGQRTDRSARHRGYVKVRPADD